MKQSLSIVYTTGRPENRFDWFAKAIYRQMLASDQVQQVIVVDACDIQRPCEYDFPSGQQEIVVTRPKPTIWQGSHRQTREDWWAMSNARNTGLCLATGDWICFVDDRCAISPGWLQGLRDAIDGGYIVYGAYEKRHGMEVVEGRISNPGKLVARDNRLEHLESIGRADRPYSCDGAWCYGCTVALPLDWAIQVGGWEQAMDGLSFEDVIFGRMLQNNGLPMRYDPRMILIEDRSPGTENSFRREDKGTSPRDKSHRSLEIFAARKQTTNREQLLRSRNEVLAGRPFPLLLDPNVDWFDGEPIDLDYYRRPNSRHYTATNE